MKPHRILLFILTILAMLFLVATVFPEDGVKITENFKLQFLTYNEIFSPTKIQYADISPLINESFSTSDSFVEVQHDTLSGVDTLMKEDSLEKKVTVRSLEFPDSSHCAIDPFFTILANLESSKELVRIIHYGDSQIEGDRISGTFRSKLQEKFGGCGVGMVSAFDIDHYSSSLFQYNAGDWNRYYVHKAKLDHRRYGPLTNFSRFSPFQSGDSVIYEGTIKIKRSQVTYPSMRKYSQCRIFYGYNKKTVLAELYVKDSLWKIESLNANADLQVLKWRFSYPPNEISIKFASKDSPDFYAVSLDCDHGVAVDNVPVRGSAGLEFTKMDAAFLSKSYKLLNVKMLILQYGVNIVPNVQKDYGYYESWFFEQLNQLKKWNPELSIIVIGVSDMSKNEKDGYVSYPNIEQIRDAQKKAAFRAGCAFWDLYEAMGGKNSMPSWVKAKPSLARKDFIHFSAQGAELVSTMFYDAFMQAYEDYLERTENEKWLNVKNNYNNLVSKD